jgi:hypothetical protein
MSLSAARNTRFLGQYERLMHQPVEAATTLYVGGLVALDANGYLVPAQDTGSESLATLIVYGICSGTYLGYPGQNPVNTTSMLIPGTNLPAGTAAAISAECFTGIALLDIGGSSITQDDIGKLCYAEDDHTVYLAQDTTRPVAGTIVGLEAGGVWVDIRKKSAIG